MIIKRGWRVRDRKSQPEGLETANPCDADVAHMDALSGFTRIFILQENIYATRVVTLPAEELGTMAKNNSRRITLGIMPIYGGLTPTLDPIL